MSYSTCLKCKKMVFSYEKYCENCVAIYNLKQDRDWHKENRFGVNVDEEIKKDKKPKENKKAAICCDNYKVNKFKKVLKANGFKDFHVKSFTNSESLFKIKTTSDRIPEIKRICEEVELFFKKGN